jgi:hypothetical protein
MSIRTIVEINHDLIHRIEEDEFGFVSTLLVAVLTRSGGNANDLMTRFGARILATRHHSDDGKIVMKSGLEFDLP